MKNVWAKEALEEAMDTMEETLVRKDRTIARLRKAATAFRFHYNEEHARMAESMNHSRLKDLTISSLQDVAEAAEERYTRLSQQYDNLNHEVAARVEANKKLQAEVDHWQTLRAHDISYSRYCEVRVERDAAISEIKRMNELVREERDQQAARVRELEGRLKNAEAAAKDSYTVRVAAQDRIDVLEREIRMLKMPQASLWVSEMDTLKAKARRLTDERDLLKKGIEELLDKVEL